MTTAEIAEMAKALGVSPHELTIQLAKRGLTPTDAPELENLLLISQEALMIGRGPFEELLTKLSASPKCQVRTLRQFVNKEWIDVFARMRIKRH
jgi:hypothetical protein